jgi:DNA-binding NarL/FixJ family response regulator
MICTTCARENRAEAIFCDGCGARLDTKTFGRVGDFFVGREGELAALTKALDDSQAGRGRIVMLCGEPGIGKTRTAEAAAGLAESRGFAVLWGRCYEVAGAPPYWPWVQALRGWLDSSSDEQLRRCAGSGAGTIADLVGELRERLPGLPPTPPAPHDDVARFRLFEAISALWRRAAAERPLLLVLDDLHWADTPSLKLLEFFSHEVAANAILLLGTFRDIEVSRQHPLSDTLGDLSRRSRFQRLQLAGLNLIESSQYIAVASGRALSSTLVATVHERTEGNPLFLGEMTRFFQQEGILGAQGAAERIDSGAGPIPAGIREVIGRRLNRMSPDCNRLLSCAAVIGREFELPLLASLRPEFTEEHRRALLEEALTARVIEALHEPGCYQFSHALIRETLYDELPVPTRAGLHERVGLALEVLPGARSVSGLATMAHHFVAALPGGNVNKALDYAEKAGQRADAQLAFEEAARYYRLALQSLDLLPQAMPARRLPLLMRLGDALIKAGESFHALEAFRNAADLARELGAAEDFARAAIGFEEASWRPGLPGQAAVGLLRAAQKMQSGSEGLLQAQILAALARALIFTGDLEEARRVDAEAETLARRLGDASTLVSALLSGLAARWGPERLPSRLAAAREAIALAEQTGDEKRLVDIAGWYMFDLMEACDVAAAMRAFELQSKLAHRQRQPYWLYVGTLFKATLALFHGRFAESEALAVQASESGSRLTGQDVAGVFGLQMFNLRREQGRLGEVAPVLRQFVRATPKASTWRPGLAILYAELDLRDEARAEFDALARNDFAAVARDALWSGCITYLAEVCTFLEDAGQAERLYQYLLPHDGYNIVVGAFSACHGAAARLLGMLASTMKRWDEAERHFEAAVATNDRQNAHPWLAHSRYEYAAMLLARRRSGDEERARSLLNEALAASRGMGMRALESRASRKLQEIAPPAERVAYPAGLSRREVEVLRLVASGKSNREIAEALFRSENTVANHVRSILAKIGAANRAEAAAFAARHRLTDLAQDRR